MGNNIKLKYEDLNGIINNLNSLDNQLESAYKTLGQSTDLGSSIMQAFWRFGNKDAIFGAIKKSRTDIKSQIDENKRLMDLLRQVEGLYETSGLLSFVNSFITDKQIRYAGLISAFEISPLIGLFVVNWQKGRIISNYSGNINDFGIYNDVVTRITAIFGLPPVIKLFNKSIPNINLENVNHSDGTSKGGIGTKRDVPQKINEGDCLDDIWQNWTDVSPNGFTNYNKKGNCTWYADHRWSQMNPDYPLSFPNGISDAKGWINTIDKNKFNVLSTSDTGNIKPNSVAVSQSGSRGHVAYVEDVRDGMVYYTEDGESYTRPHTWKKDENGNWVGPTVQSCTVDDFRTKFGHVISKK